MKLKEEQIVVLLYKILLVYLNGNCSSKTQINVNTLHYSFRYCTIYWPHCILPKYCEEKEPKEEQLCIALHYSYKFIYSKR